MKPTLEYLIKFYEYHLEELNNYECGLPPNTNSELVVRINNRDLIGNTLKYLYDCKERKNALYTAAYLGFNNLED